MRKCIYIASLILIFLVLYTSCAGKIEKEVDELAQKYEELDITNPISRLTKSDYYEALLSHNVEKTRIFLDAGYDPDNCFFPGCVWEEGNPLLVVSFKWGPSDNVEEMIRLLVEYGADINHLPYIWRRVNFFDNESEKEYSNRVIKTLLDNGADPNLKGLFAPFDEEKYFSYITMTEKKARKKFKSKKATTPLYEAIKKGMRWESQVDLLLQYGAKVDESCLEAAKLSGDDQMIKKIERIIAAGTESAI